MMKILHLTSYLFTADLVACYSNLIFSLINCFSYLTAKHYPIYCLQWQPEKILYVWNPVLALDHSPDAIRVAQYIRNFFMLESRKNNHRFATRKVEERNLIYPHKILYIGNITESPYEQIYTFKHANATGFGDNVPEHFEQGIYKRKNN